MFFFLIISKKQNDFQSFWGIDIWNKYDKWAEEKDFLCLSTVCQLFVKLVPLQSKVGIIKDLPGDEGWNFPDVWRGSLYFSFVTRNP